MAFWNQVPRWREAGVFRHVYPAKLKEAVRIPDSYVAIANKQSTQFLVVMELLEDADMMINFLVDNHKKRDALGEEKKDSDEYA